ncbi:condensation domain-containing protein [Streptomyces sp. HK10]|uniref:condensation domain-containing protein n=1 Tax=Streptomyces sp. HK10 TaxID=3373255 RepID=UPI003749F6C4
MLRLLAEREAARADGRQGYRVAPAQESMLAAEAAQPSGGSHNDLVAAYLDGPLDAAALRRALQSLTERQEVLRVRFTPPPEPRMLITPQTAVDLDIRCTESGPEERQRVVEQAAAALLGERLDAFTGPLQRVVLLRLAPRRHLLLSAVHHLISDAHSHGVYLRDLAALYRAHTTGEQAKLPLVRPYREHAAARRQVLAEEAGPATAALRRSMAVLAPPLPTLTWPRTPTKRTYRQRVVQRKWPARMVGAAERALSGVGLTFGMALAAAWASALYRYAGAEDVRIGVPVANRLDPSFAHTVGLFAGMGMVRIPVGGDSTVEELLSSARESMLTAWESGAVPLPYVVRALRAAHPDLDSAAVFESTLTLQDQAEPLLVGALRITALDSFDFSPLTGPAFQPLHLSVRRGTGPVPVPVRLTYDRDLLTVAEAEALLRGVAEFLAVCAAGAERRTAVLPARRWTAAADA